MLFFHHHSAVLLRTFFVVRSRPRMRPVFLSSLPGAHAGDHDHRFDIVAFARVCSSLCSALRCPLLALLALNMCCPMPSSSSFFTNCQASLRCRRTESTANPRPVSLQETRSNILVASSMATIVEVVEFRTDCPLIFVTSSPTCKSTTGLITYATRHMLRCSDLQQDP